MAYRYDTTDDEKQELVIDGWEKGIAESPYQGIASMRNLNIKYYPGMAYVNYKLQPANLNSGGIWFAGTHSTNVSGNAGWIFTAPGAGASSSQFTAWAQSPAGIVYLIDSSGTIQKQTSVGSNNFTALTGNPAGGTGQGIAFWKNYLIVFRGTSIDVCGDGTGDAGVTSANWNPGTMFPITLQTSISLTGTPAAAANSATLSSAWAQPTGTYQATIALTGGPPNSQIIYVAATNGSTAITWTPNLWLAAAAGTLTNVTAITNSAHPTFISSNDGYLYFGNGFLVGQLFTPVQQTFNPLVKTSFGVTVAALGLPDFESISWISELRTNLLIGGSRKIYPWDRVSTSWQTPIPVTEPIKKITNIMNNIYILAGNKGNIYFSNGYAIAIKKKIPDSFFGLVDPQITWGGYMQHRNKLYFQVYVQDSKTQIPVASGVMSYDIETEALNFDNENSIGYTPSGSNSGVGNILIDVSDTSSSLFDNYLSSWYNSSIGGIDYNDTTLYSNNEPQIETDLIPVGTFANPKTFTSIEFKLDEPMVSGDSITVYARQSLSDTYVLVGTTTTGILSDFYTPLPFEKFQWLQLKVTMSCGMSSTRIRIKEIRIR